MSWVVGYNNPEFEDYTGLEDYDEVYQAVKTECAAVVDEMGSEIGDPADHLTEPYTDDQWFEALEELRQTAVVNMTIKIMQQVATPLPRGDQRMEFMLGAYHAFIEEEG